MEGKGAEERKKVVEKVAERKIGRKARIKGVGERIGEGGRQMLMVEMEKERDKDELLLRSGEIKKKWDIGMDEDLTLEERRTRWRMVGKAKG